MKRIKQNIGIIISLILIIYAIIGLVISIEHTIIHTSLAVIIALSIIAVIDPFIKIGHKFLRIKLLALMIISAFIGSKLVFYVDSIVYPLVMGVIIFLVILIKTHEAGFQRWMSIIFSFIFTSIFISGYAISKTPESTTAVLSMSISMLAITLLKNNNEKYKHSAKVAKRFVKIKITKLKKK